MSEAQAPDRAFLEPPRWLVRLTGWAWRLLVIGVAALALGWMALQLRVVVVPILVATMVASVLSPLVRRLTRRGVPALAATWLVLVGVLTVVGGVLAGAAWGLTAELTQDSARWSDVANDVRNWLATGPLDLSEQTIDDIEQRLRQSVIGGVSSLGTSRATLVVELLSGLFLTAALTFFFVKDGPEMWGWLVEHVHPQRRRAVDQAGREAVATLSAYLKAVSITGVVDSVAIGVGLLLIGVPLVIPLAVITFFGAFLPVVGATAAGGLAALVALVANGPGDAALVVILTLAVQQIEGDVVMPVVMGRQVPLHPAAVLAALAAGGAIAGVIGAFVAVPLAAVMTTAIGVLRSHRAPWPVGAGDG
ncbi:MAG: AI-2E family transporter [Acidimicrobiales bacterium]|nr:AI-2E family transporter [Acidimicrobiales bacterium]